MKTRQEYVLNRMLEDGKITVEEHDQAIADPITTNVQSRGGSCGSSKYPFYCQLVMNWLLDDTMLGVTAEEREHVVAAGGLEVKTPLDPVMLEQLESQLKTDWGVTNPKILRLFSRARGISWPLDQIVTGELTRPRGRHR